MKILNRDWIIDLEKTILWQYDKAENLQTLVNEKQAWYKRKVTDFIVSFFYNIFNIRTATDFGLNIWGKILNFPRQVVNKNNGTIINLTTEQYRFLLLGQILKFKMSCTVPEINKYLALVFNDNEGRCYVQDNQNMTIQYIIGVAVPAEIQALLDNVDFLPRPAGVRVIVGNMTFYTININVYDEAGNIITDSCDINYSWEQEGETETATGESVTVPASSTVTYSIEKKGYFTQTSTISNISADENLIITLVAYKGLKFTAQQANSTISYVISGSPIGTDFKYSLDGNSWTAWTSNTILTLSNVGDFIFVKGDNENGLNSYAPQNYIHFAMSGKIAASGNINSLLDNGDGSTISIIPNRYCFNYLFENCTSLTTPPSLPATELKAYCYNGMFAHSGITRAPELPADKLSSSCYAFMFEDCKDLIYAPHSLPATTLSESCYNRMFGNCYKLETTPELPATTLVADCYYSMFLNCKALVVAPTLPATIVSSGSYMAMFAGCTNLTTVPLIAATMLDARSCFNQMFDECTSLNYIKIAYTGNFDAANFNWWVRGVASSGDFYYNGSDTTRGDSAIPTNWTIHTF